MHIKTAAERQRDYRESMKKKGYRHITIWVDSEGNKGSAEPQEAARIAENNAPEEARNGKAALKAQWEAELKAEQMKAAKAEGRKLARQQDRTHFNGRITAFCDAAAFFIGKGRDDIAQDLLKNFCVDRHTAESALQSDKRVKSITLDALDSSGVWNA